MLTETEKGKSIPLNPADDGPIQPLAIFDYDKNRNYRFWLVKEIDYRCMTEKGKGNGFSFKNKVILNAPIRPHKRKDYIVVQEENGQLHILNRTGKTRIKVPEKINFLAIKCIPISIYLPIQIRTETCSD